MLQVKMLKIIFLHQVILVEVCKRILICMLHAADLTMRALGKSLIQSQKKIFRRQNPLELIFKDISIFDAQNPIVGSLLKELDIGRKDIASTLTKNVTNSVDIEIQSRLNTLKNNKK